MVDFVVFHIWRCRICSCRTIVFAMASFLLPLSTAQVAAHHNVESLVDVAVQNKDGTPDIVTFDSMLLLRISEMKLSSSCSFGPTMRMCYPCQVMELGMGKIQGQRQWCCCPCIIRGWITMHTSIPLWSKKQSLWETWGSPLFLDFAASCTAAMWIFVISTLLLCFSNNCWRACKTAKTMYLLCFAYSSCFPHSLFCEIVRFNSSWICQFQCFLS